MPGLLDLQPDQWGALGLLGQGIAHRNFTGGATAAIGYLDKSKEDALKQQYVQAQIAETQAQMQERQMKARKEQEAFDQAARVHAALPGLFQQPGMTGGAPQPQSEGGIPMFSKPMGVTPMRQTPGGFDVQGAVRLGLDPKVIAEYAGLTNLGRPEVARTVEGRNPQGQPVTMQFDKYGQPVGDGVPQWKAPVFEGLGNRRVAIDPVTLKEQASYGVGQSPDSVASNAVTMRGQNMIDARARETNSLGHVPAGYRQTATGGLEFIPGGPADPNAAKRAAPTEFQGKSATYGARALEADKILLGLDGKYMPGAVNTKNSLESIPGVGGALGAGANYMLSDNGQKAEQAQRDFANAVLRQESGAAISASEFDNAKKQYFPQPFDSAAVKEQKARNRQLVIQGFLANSRPGAMEGVLGGAPSTGGATGGWAIREVK